MARFVQISMGSCSELSSHLLLASELGFLDQATYKSLGTDWSEVMTNVVCALPKAQECTSAQRLS